MPIKPPFQPLFQRPILILAAPLFALACTAPPLDPPGPGGPPFVVQEWGTYTSVQASDGHALGGVHHVDEALPAWVHSRNFSNSSSYFFEMLPEEPLQQLETPVLYFWADRPTEARVRIDFPQGVVGEWFPDASAFTPALHKVERLGNGSMTWDVTVDPTLSRASYLPVPDGNIWAPSRNVASTPVRFASAAGSTVESEQFIFYRGLGRFEPPVHVTADRDNHIHIRNTSSDDLAATFVLHVSGGRGQVLALGGLRAGQTRSLAIPAPARGVDDYVAEARRVLEDALVASGLKEDVARAMVDTWTRSWFNNLGLRVLYLAPRSWTDGYLPTKIEPAPTSLVRTLVGRIEVLTPGEEDQLVADLRAFARSQAPFDLTHLGRFAEPRLRRAVEQLGGAERDYAQTILDKAHREP